MNETLSAAVRMGFAVQKAKDIAAAMGLDVEAVVANLASDFVKRKLASVGIEPPAVVQPAYTFNVSLDKGFMVKNPFYHTW